LAIADGRLPIADLFDAARLSFVWQLPMADCRLPIANCRFV
jgi:hypothetical protein